MVKEQLNEETYDELVKAIESKGYHYIVSRHKLECAQPASPEEYMYKGTRLQDLVRNALQGRDMSERDIEMFCLAVPGYLERPYIHLEYIPDKQQRDHYLRKVITREEAVLIDSSCTRSTNIRTISSIFSVLMVGEYPGYEKTFNHLFLIQKDEQFTPKRMVIAQITKDLVRKFCIELIS